MRNYILNKIEKSKEYKAKKYIENYYAKELSALHRFLDTIGNFKSFNLSDFSKLITPENSLFSHLLYTALFAIDDDFVIKKIIKKLLFTYIENGQHFIFIDNKDILSDDDLSEISAYCNNFSCTITVGLPYTLAHLRSQSFIIQTNNINVINEADQLDIEAKYFIDDYYKKHGIQINSAEHFVINILSLLTSADAYSNIIFSDIFKSFNSSKFYDKTNSAFYMLLRTSRAKALNIRYFASINDVLNDKSNVISSFACSQLKYFTFPNDDISKQYINDLKQQELYRIKMFRVHFYEFLLLEKEVHNSFEYSNYLNYLKRYGESIIEKAEQKVIDLEINNKYIFKFRISDSDRKKYGIESIFKDEYEAVVMVDINCHGNSEL